MSGKNVLIAYGTRYGATEEAAQEIARVLEAENIKSTLIDLKKTEQQNWPPLSGFDGVLVASGIRASQWTKRPKEFLKTHKEELQRKERILGIYVCCGDALLPEKRPQAKLDYIETVVGELGIHPDISDVFGGILDSKRMSFLSKIVLKIVMNRRMKEYSTNHGKEGIPTGVEDLRDWNQVREFAKQFAALIRARDAPRS